MSSDRSTNALDSSDGSNTPNTAAANGSKPGPPPRIKSALLWGVVGAFAFLALVQGYALLVAPLVTIVQGVTIAAIVGGGVAIGAYALEYRIAAWAAQRVTDESESHDGAD